MDGSRKRKATQLAAAEDEQAYDSRSPSAVGEGTHSSFPAGNAADIKTFQSTTDTNPVIVPTKEHDGPSRRKSRKQTPSSASSSRASSASRAKNKSVPNIPWPEPFKSLSQTHRALNLVYTFCCARKHFATTFENIKAVEAQMGGQRLTVEDVARVKALIPRGVRFEAVDAGLLDIMNTHEEKVWQDWEAEDMGDDQTPTEKKSGNEVLLFEFVDGDLRRERPQGAKPRKSRDDVLNMPVYNQKQMLQLIERRNKKFSEAVDELLEAESEAYIPTPVDSGASTPAAAKLPAQIPKERKTISEIITEIRDQDWYFGQIVPDGHRVLEAQSAVYGDLIFAMSQNLVNALYNTRQITQLYSHQAEAINNLHNGHNVIVSTSTSSGKSLIYQIPMLHQLEVDRDSRGMYIFPTKALAQDQRQNLQNLLRYMDGLEDILVATFDGDTPMSDRDQIRDEARIIFTNPDMLHVTILPQEGRWRTFLKNLKFVVVDELHVYNGLFGSHVAFIMRRLRRICASVGNRHVKFVSCSATVANPEEHMKAIFGIDDVKLTEIDGSPSGRKEFICWNTPFKDPKDSKSGRGNSTVETARLFCQLILRGVRVIAFCRVRKQCEMLLTAVKDEFRALDRSNVSRLVMGYRGGYSPQDRRKIEREMFEGKLLGIVATNALELGVDIGSLDAVITLSFPYSISNLRQQSGRAGRRNKDSLSVLVGDSNATDQHYMQNPDEIFSKPNCELLVDLHNELILEGHVQCAAFEMPIRPEEDAAYFGPQLLELAATRLIKDDLGFYHCHERFRPQPSRCVSIRGADNENYAVVDTTNNRNIVIEEIEDTRVSFTLYEGGIFLHQGNTYLVKEVNPHRRFARVVRAHVDWTTQQRDISNIDPVETEAIRIIDGGSTSKAFFGGIKINILVYGYFKLDKNGRILDAIPLDNPPIELMTKGMWIDVPKKALDILASRNLNAAAAIHAAEHAILSLMPTFIVSAPGDVRTECKVALKELGPKHISPANRDRRTLPPPPRRQRPARLTFYDTKGGSGGSGIAAKAFEFVDSLLRRAHSRVEACTCITPQGCVECVCDERCHEMNVVMSKAGAGVILKCLLGIKVDVDSLPWGEELQRDYVAVPGEARELAQGLETVIEAVEVSGKPGQAVKVYGAP
jgi:DEAD/DEAH box helicase domain-containing protein